MWGWVLGAVGALTILIVASPLVFVVALVVLITAIIGLRRGTKTWLRLGSRKIAIGVTAGAAGALLIAGSMSAALTSPGGVAPPTADGVRLVDDTGSGGPRNPDVMPTPTPTPTPTPVTTTREEVVTEPIAFERTSYEDANLPRGQNPITVAGQSGERSLTYLVTLVDGVETGRVIVSDVVTVQPVTEVTAIGVYDPPPPPPPPPANPGGGCDPNYADACVPIASDVDCGGGSGNGPAYFHGVARVVGADIYDLDRDGDGLACEP